MTTRLQTIQLCVVFLFIAYTPIVVACPTIVSRSIWEADPSPSPLQNLKVNPPSIVFIHHTADRTDTCTDQAMCSGRVKGIQDKHIYDNNWDDIGYNFLIGGDGAAYEGRGWGKEGPQAYGFNDQSISIALIGDFSQSSPSVKMQNATKELIKCGVNLRNIDPDYTLYGHLQARATESPAVELYKIIKTWNKWSPEWLYGNEKCKELDGKCMDNSANCSGHYVNGECSGPSYVQCCVPCPVTPLDIQFLLDESGSIGPYNFNKTLKFVREYAESFQIGPEKIQFGVATFSSIVENQFWLNSYRNESSVLQAIDAISYSSGGTNTHLGLDFIREQAFTAEHGDRPNITNVLIIITDGLSNYPNLTKIAAEKIHQTDIVVLAIGVGGYNEKELALIATDNTTVFHVDNYIALKYIQDDLRKVFCEDEVPDDDSFPQWGVIALSVGGSVVVLGAVAGVTGIIWLKLKGCAAAAAAAGGAA